MIKFERVYSALKQGKHVRQRRWDNGSELFVQDGELMELVHGKTLVRYQLDWRDINRKDWIILPPATVNTTAL